MIRAVEPLTVPRRVRPTGTSADLARRRGWGVGTELVGDEGYGPTVIRITAVGDTSVLARCVSRDGKPARSVETLWSLLEREWEPVSREPEYPPEVREPSVFVGTPEERERYRAEQRVWQALCAATPHGSNDRRRWSLAEDIRERGWPSLPELTVSQLYALTAHYWGRASRLRST